MQQTATLSVSVLPGEKEAYTLAANKMGVSLTEWVRRSLNAVVGGDYRIGTTQVVASEVLRACSVGFRPTPAPTTQSTKGPVYCAGCSRKGPRQSCKPCWAKFLAYQDKNEAD